LPAALEKMTTGPGKPKDGSSRVNDQDFVTSEDLFGEMVDAPMPAPEEPIVPVKRAGRKGPIKVQVSEPGLPSDSKPRAVRGEELPPEEMEALLDRISAITPAHGHKTDPSGEDVDSLLSRLSPLDDEVPEASSAAPSTDTPPVSSPEVEMRLPAAEEGEEEDDIEFPAVASRTGTKFQVAEAPPKEESLPGLDLADLAENALDEATPAPKAPEGARGRPHWRDDTYGPYRLIDRVAVGGMAEVFKAKRSGVEGFEKVVAVKRILPHLSDNQEFVDMFVDEAKMVAGLTHPNIVQIFDLGRIEKTYYIAMDYVHGHDLRTILKRAKEKGMRMPLDLSLHIVQEVCSALEYAHRKKDDQGRPMEIVHRDVSPQNIMISFEGDVKLTDFGIAKAATKASNTDRGALRGKLLYMSPEQAWGKPIDRRSDIFSLGIVLYEMITDQKPFLGGTTELSILEAVRQGQIDPPRGINPRIPESLENVVMKALAPDPDDRYQDAGEMHRGLEWVLRERQPPAAGELARLLEVLFDQEEREDATPEARSGEVRPAARERPADTPAPAPETAPDANEPAVPDEMSLDTLLKRFGIE
jgi:serine/threonine protein kinase